MRRSPLMAGGLAILLALLTVLASADSVHAGTFNPRLRFCFDDVATVDENPTLSGDPGECDGSNAAGSPAAFGLGFDVDKGDVNFGAIVTYLPNEWQFARGEDIPIGTKVGTVEAIATIGIINGPCDNVLTLVGTAGFSMLNASLNINDTITFPDEDKGDTTKQDWAEDLDGNGLFDAIDKYPDFINRIVKDEDDNPQEPIRRSAGTIIVAGADVLLQYLIYEPGTFINKNLSNDADLGYPVVTFLQNAGDPDIVPEPGPITDFCTPLGAFNTSFGMSDPCDSVADDDDDGKVNDGCPAVGESEADAETEDGNDPCDNAVDDDRQDDRTVGDAAARVNDGCPQEGDENETDLAIPLYANPPDPGTFTITSIAVGQPDTDGDGLENGLDTCPYTENVGDPRIRGDGDGDEDGLDNACDPNDDPLSGGTNSDEDGDGYLNRQDNCPLKSNGEDTTNQDDEDKDAEGDRQIDGIGNVCDDEQEVFNGEPLAERLRTLEENVEIGPRGDDFVQIEPGGGPEPNGPTQEDGDDDGGGGAIVFIIIGVVAAVIVIGGGGYLLMRRGGGGGAAA